MRLPFQPKNLVRRASCAVLVFLLVASCRVSGATLTWTGLASDNSVNSAANWSPAQAPATGDLFVFAGSTRLAPQSATSLTVGSITFNNTAGAFTLGGLGAYTINSAGVTNNSASLETISNAIVLGAAQSWSASSGALAFTSTV